MKTKGTTLRNEDHVMRYVPWSKLRKDEDENVLGFLPQAFELRQDEQSLSVNWLEYFDGDRAKRIQNCVTTFRNTRSVGKKSAFGIANIGKTKETCRANGASVRIVYDPESGNQAHSTIRHLPRDDLTLLEALATEAFAEIVHNADVP